MNTTPNVSDADVSRRRSTKAEPAANEAAPESVRALLDACDGLVWNRGTLSGEDAYVFLHISRDASVPLPDIVPHVATEDDVYFLVRNEVELPDYFETYHHIRGERLIDAVAFIPAPVWPEPDEPIVSAIMDYTAAVREALARREAVELLERERNAWEDKLYASLGEIDDVAPMLVEGFMRERGLAVFYGDPDSFKTTLVLDMVAHISAGAPHWQGRKVFARPVIWYALEGADEIPARVRALETRVRNLDPDWGDDMLPITVLDRIPETEEAWREEIYHYANRWEQIIKARFRLGEIQSPTGKEGLLPLYPSSNLPIVVIDTLSMALGGEDEKGHPAVGFIHKCRGLLKTTMEDSESPVADHIIIIHHQTKSGGDIAGHRAIWGDTDALYHVRRHGKRTDADRPYAGQLTPERTKGMVKPPPMRFEVDVVPVEGTQQTAAILKDKAAAVPKRLTPIVDALRELEDDAELSRDDLNACLDVISEASTSGARRVARTRNRGDLEAAGIIEPIENEAGETVAYRFHDPAKARG